MKIVVTGANGMLGQDLCPILEDEGFDVVETDIFNLDITNLKNVQEFLKEQAPQYLIHCAAYTNVNKAEEEANIAFKINKTGTENIAEICSELNIIPVYISTDYVFDGEKEGKYIPSDKPNPINKYGETKLAGEKAIQEKCDKYYITRTSWLYGHHGKNFVETMIKMSGNPELKVVNDQIGCPTWTVDLSNAIIKLIKNNKPYGIYHLCGSGETSWYEFAKEIFNLSNIQANLQPCASKDFPSPAKRPKNSVMENNKMLRDWKLALKEYIDLRCE